MPTPTKTGICMYFTFEFRNYLELFSPSIGLKPAPTDFGTPAIISQRKYESIAAVAHVLQNIHNLVISRCCFVQRTA